MPVWGWVLIGLGIFVVLICGLFFAGLAYIGQRASTQLISTFSIIGSGIDAGELVQTGVVLNFYDNLESRDYDAARELLSPQLAEKYTADNLRTKWEALEKAAGTITPGFPDSTSTGNDQASITQELTSEHGQSYSVKLKVERVDSTWKITEADPDLIPSP
jgi:hypothetical protein